MATATAALEAAEVGNDPDVVDGVAPAEAASRVADQSAQAAAAAEKLNKQAANLKSDADGLDDKAKGLEAKVTDLQGQIGDLHKKADKAAELRKKSAELLQQATGLERDAAPLNKKEAEESQLETAAKRVEGEAQKERKSAQDTENQAMGGVAASRVCLDMGGVQLKGNGLATFDPIVGEHPVTDAWKCRDWCQKHADCEQSVFTWETKTCELFQERTSEPIKFRET